MPRSARTIILTVEIIALGAFVVAMSGTHLSGLATLRLLALAGLSVLHAETTARIERMRIYLDSSAHIDMTSVWSFAAVFALPAGYAAILLVFLFAFSTWRRRRQRAVVPHRVIYSTSAALIAVLAASATMTAVEHQLPGLPGAAGAAIAVFAALVVFFGLNTALVLTIISLAMGRLPLLDMLSDRDELGLEFGTLILGIFAAESLLRDPWLTPLVIVLMVLLQRSSLVTQLEIAAATDAKTGLLNAAAWQELAQRELLRCKRENSPSAVLLLDLDHFKNVNDTLGHLAGDSALRAIGDALKRELRGYDAVARFGGEEFVVFLNDLDLSDALLVAERTLSRIRGLSISSLSSGEHQIALTASIGAAACPEHGTELTELLEMADSALYAAKRGGRDRVSVPPSTEPASEHA